jgi:energy-converting hydrogenase Eha subunit A
MSPEIILDLKLIGITAVIAYGFTEILKPLMKQGNKRKASVRALALITAGVAGYFIYPALGGTNEIVGLSLGLCAGALNAIIVAIIKKRMKNLDGDSNE